MRKTLLLFMAFILLSIQAINSVEKQKSSNDDGSLKLTNLLGDNYFQVKVFSFMQISSY